MGLCPNPTIEQDTRAAGRLIAEIEARGREVAEAVEALKGLTER
jgi:hypothetical protein